MSLYTMQKFLFQLNREPEVQRRFAEDRAALLAEYALEPEESSTCWAATASC
jgi:hypothetical protein